MITYPVHRAITTIVVHCSATPNGRANTIEDIDGWHAQRRFRRAPEAVKHYNPQLGHVGYHYVIEVDGKACTGRGLDEVGAHVAGHNAHSIGICLVGTDQYTTAQWAALRWLLKELKLYYPAANVVGHRDLSPDQDGDGVVEPSEWLKTCPGFDAPTWVRVGMPVPNPGHTLPPAGLTQ